MSDLFKNVKEKKVKKKPLDPDFQRVMEAIIGFTTQAQAINDRLTVLEKHMAYLLSKDPGWVAAYESQAETTDTSNE